MPYLDTYSGNWSTKEARHLLKRASFGVTQSLVSEAVTLGLSPSITKLFETNALPESPLKYQSAIEILNKHEIPVLYHKKFIRGFELKTDLIGSVKKEKKDFPEKKNSLKCSTLPSLVDADDSVGFGADGS